MTGDGVSLQTNLVQLGNVAKSTARSTQVPHGATPGSEAADHRETAKLHRVNEADKTAKQHVDPDHRREQEHSQEHADGQPARAEGDAEPDHDSADEAARTAGVGGLFDRKA